MIYSHLGCCGNSRFNLLRSFSSSLRDIAQASLALFPLRSLVLQKYVVDNLVMCENRVNTHTHILTANLRALIYSFPSKRQTVGSLFSSRLPNLLSDIYLRCGAPPLRVAAQEALHHHITALPVGTHRAMLETPYFHFNY